MGTDASTVPDPTMRDRAVSEGVSIVIPYYGDPAPTLALVGQLREQRDAPETEIIIADDCSPVPFPDTDGVILVRREVNGGFGAAVNSGARLAKNPLLLILNSDVRVSHTFVRDLLDASRPWQPAVTAPRLVDLDGASQWGGRHFPRHSHHIIEWLSPLARFRERLHEAVGHDTRCVEGATVPVDWLVGAALLLPTRLFHDAGGFDEGYFMNSEEIDLQRRLRARGIPSVFLGGVRVEHEGGGSSATGERVRWVTQSRLRYAQKWGERPELLRAGLRVASAVNLLVNATRRLAGRDVHPFATWRRELSFIAREGRQ